MRFAALFKATVKHALVRRVEHRWRSRNPDAARAHGLDRELVVSLTSFPARFPTLPLTLRCLLTQTVKPDRLILWLCEEDVAALPADVLSLQSYGLDIRTCAEHRSYNKIIPALTAFPGAVIVTADDDLYYWPRWLEGLTSACDPDRAEVLCHRAHRITTDRQGMPQAYGTWKHNVGAASPSPLLFPTGVGGVLYPPGALHRDVLDSATYLHLSPTNDDIWLYFMACRNGATVRKVGRRRRIVTWPQSQHVSLRSANVPAGGGNDRQMAAMAARYGFPPLRHHSNRPDGLCERQWASDSSSE